MGDGVVVSRAFLNVILSLHYRDIAYLGSKLRRRDVPRQLGGATGVNKDRNRGELNQLTDVEA